MEQPTIVFLVTALKMAVVLYGLCAFVCMGCSIICLVLMCKMIGIKNASVEKKGGVEPSKPWSVLEAESKPWPVLEPEPSKPWSVLEQRPPITQAKPALKPAPKKKPGVICPGCAAQGAQTVRMEMGDKTTLVYACPACQIEFEVSPEAD